MINEVRIKKFNLNSAKKIFNKLSNFYNEKDVISWKRNVSEQINNLFTKYQVVDYKLNKNSYMGIVIWCQCLENKEIYIKFVPPFIERFNTEIGTLKLLPKKLICQIYEINYEFCFFVMEKIAPGNLVDFDGNEKLYKKLFDELYKNRMIVDENDGRFKNFNEVVAKDYNILKKYIKVDQKTKELYIKFTKIYNKLCNNNSVYLLHGDVYKNNVVSFNDTIKIIDPLGFKAPFVMELVSICAYEMLYSKKSNIKILNKYVDFFSCYVNEKTYKDALFCQLVKVYIPSIYEANDGGKRATKWLSIINDLY